MLKLPKQEDTTEFREQAVAQVNGGRGKVVTPEKMALSRLRAEVVRLKRENEI